MKKSSLVADLILSFGSLGLLGIIILYIVTNTTNHRLFLDFLPICVVLLGIPLLIIGVKLTKKLHHVFIGQGLIFWGLILFCSMLNVFHFSFRQWWPVIGVTSGIFLYIAGLVSYRSIKFRYFIPALTLFLLGIWFMLFTFNIIKVPFHIVALVGGPLFFIMTGMFIIIFFMLQKKYTNLVIPEDEASEFEAEEIIENEKSEE